MGSPIESISSSKRALRESWKKSFPQDPTARKSASLAICQTLINHSGFIQAPQIGLFAARIFEIDLLPLLAMTQKAYFFPKVDSSTQQLHFFSVAQLEHLFNSPAPWLAKNISEIQNNHFYDSTFLAGKKPLSVTIACILTS